MTLKSTLRHASVLVLALSIFISGTALAQFPDMFGGGQSGGSGAGVGSFTGAAGGLGAAPLTSPSQPVAVPTITNQGGDTDKPQGESGASQRRLAVPDQRDRNEFQDFVLQSTGRDLPIFGTELFRNAVPAFAPMENALAPADYVVGPGDEVHVRGWGQIVVDYRVRVGRDGTISFPQVGTVMVAGTPYQNLNSVVKAAFSRLYRNFDMSVALTRLRSIQVFVVGQARQPGTYTVSALSTLVNAVFAAGGPSSKGSMRRIELKRGNKVIGEFDFYDLLIKGDKSKDVALQAGDVIYVPPLGPLVGVTGSVNVPAIYELRGNAPLGDLLGWAGGLAPTALGQRVTVERIENRSVRKVDEFTLDARGQATPLRDGDLVTVHAVAPRFDNAVTLRGNVVQPGRFPWRAGMTIRDLIPSRDALVTRDYWVNRNQSVGLAPDVQRILGQQQGAGTSLSVSDLQRRLQDEPSVTVAEDIRRRQVDADASRLVEMTSGSRGQNRNPPAQPAPVQSTQATPQAGLGGQNGQLGGLQPVPPATSQPVVAQRPPSTRPDPATESSRLINQIRPNLKEVNWEYAVVERVNQPDLSTRLIPFNLGRAVLGGDAQHNLALEPGDVVTIFSKEDLKASISKQTKFVRLEGEFVAPGVYQVLPGETLRQLVNRLGGFTSEAYVFGAEFTRESTQAQQARNLEEAVNRLEREIQQYNTIRPANLTAPEDVAALRAQIEGQSALIAKLRQLRPNGRIVLELPEDARIRDIPDIALEDGDRLFVPNRPSMVNVFGSVYSEASFVYRADKRLNDYLSQAGGPTRSADTSSTYILRSDGSVMSTRNNTSFFGGFEARPIMPGDTIVVPEEFDRSTWRRALRDWAQIFYQFGLGAAAVKVLRN